MGNLLALIALSLPTTNDEAPSSKAVRSAVEKALPLIVKSTREYPRHRTCFSCHHQAVPVLAMRTAKDRRFAFDEDAIGVSVDLAESDLLSEIDAYKKGTGQGGGVTRAGYALMTMELGGTERNELTDAVVSFLLKRDDSRDHWKTSSNRPPSEASEFTTTYVALRALSAYGTDADRDRVSSRIAKARAWLESARTRDAEDRVFRLLGLQVAKADPVAIRDAVDALRKTQRADGGWSQLDGGSSDAYATGSALVALNRAGGVAADDPAYRRGLAFLVRSQRDDGSWFVSSRSKAFQPYFESGFPYGKDQFISMAATSWAVAALALAGDASGPR